MTLDKKSDVPLYVQVKNLLKEEILRGEQKGKIPSERELMDRYSVSRATIRQSIKGLVEEGLLEIVHGKGTFISLRPVEEWLGNLTSFNEIVARRGMKPDIRLLHQATVSAPNIVSEKLGVTQVYVIKRLRFADEIPVAIEEQYYPFEIGVELAKYDLNNAAIYDLLENRIGINLAEAEQTISSSILSKKESELLNIKPRQSVIITERVVYDIENRPIEYERIIYRSDLYKFRIKLKRSKI